MGATLEWPKSEISLLHSYKYEFDLLQQLSQKISEIVVLIRSLYNRVSNSLID